MRPSVFLLLSLSLTGASASSWFEYSEWSTIDLKKWLKERNINVPETYSQEQLKELVQSNWNSASAWTYDQYASAQKSFADLREASFDAWDESRLREFLLEQGVVAPKGPREQLVLLAKNKYAAYTNAASSFSTQASTAIYGDSTHQMSKSASSVSAQATREAARKLDGTKDYGVLAKDAADKKRAQLLALMQDAYAKVTTPVWEAWSDSYMCEWLIAHDLTDVLKAKMASYYYDMNDSVDLKAWLVAHGVVKSDAQVQREKLVKLIADNYANAQDTLWGAWSDSQMREWLIEHGETTCLRSATRSLNVCTQTCLDESALPTSRRGFSETRIRWVQATTTFDRIKEIVNSGVEAAEEKVARVMDVLMGEGEKAKGEAKKGKENVKAKASAEL
ncbi:hypothetical protein B0H10DRAFT_1985029 [Mycena sp. CBHHK59/15]|nr:hypothetical protein B0H10DRAFT_1985029 [Mycena sp. CBHHK59/15]